MIEDYFNEECLRSSNKFGETIVQNVCTLEEVRVPWEFEDWFGFVAIVVATIVVYIEIVKALIELKEGK